MDDQPYLLEVGKWPGGFLESEAEHCVNAIRKVAAEHPSWTSDEVTAELVRMATSDAVIRKWVEAAG